MRGSLCREALRNLARRLSCGLNSLCRGTSTGGSTGGAKNRRVRSSARPPEHRADAAACPLGPQPLHHPVGSSWQVHDGPISPPKASWQSGSSNGFTPRSQFRKRLEENPPDVTSLRTAYSFPQQKGLALPCYLTSWGSNRSPLPLILPLKCFSFFLFFLIKISFHCS